MKIINHVLNRVLSYGSVILLSSIHALSQNIPITASTGKSQFMVKFEPNQQKHSNDYTAMLREKLKRGNDDQLKLIRNEHDASGNIHQRFQQYYKGVKVEHGIVIAHSKNNALTSVNGNYPALQSISLTPSLTEQQALQRALNYTKAKHYKWEDATAEDALKAQTKKPAASYYPKGELVICEIIESLHPRFHEHTLAYKFDVYASEPLSRQYIYVDAKDGSIVLRDAILKPTDATGQAATHYSGARTINTEFTGTTYRLHDNTRGGGIVTYKLDATNNLSEVTDSDNNWTSAEYNNGTLDDAALDAHWGAMMSYDYWRNVHGRNSYDDKNSPVISQVHYAAGDGNTDNAYWDGASNVMLFGDGYYDAIHATPFTTLDLCAHEFGHAITQYTSGLIYAYESGALNEGFSDIWAACVEHYAAPAKQTWLIGEDQYPEYFIRSLAEPNSSRQPDTYKGTFWRYTSNDFGEVHTNSGVLTFWFYLLSIGGTGINDNGANYALTGIGINEASKIAYQARFYLSPSSQYEDARTATIQAAIDLYGANSNQTDETKKAWDAVGVYVNMMIAPTQLTLNIISTTQVSLTWQDTNPIKTGYIIERSVSSGQNYATIGTTNASTLFYTDNTMLDGVTYYYRVHAITDQLVSPPSNEVTVAMAVGTNIPTLLMSNGKQVTCQSIFTDTGGRGEAYKSNENYTLTLSPATPGAKIALTFSSLSIDEFDRMIIYDGSDTKAPVIKTLSDNGWTSGTIPPPTVYASAANLSGELTINFGSSYLPVTGFGWEALVTCITMPNAPDNLQSTLNNNNVGLIWTDNSNNETAFEVERSLDMGKTFTKIATLQPNVSSYSDLNIITNMVYQYRVKAVTSVYGSEYTNVSSAQSGQTPFTKIDCGLPNFGLSYSDWGDYDNDGDIDVLLRAAPSANFKATIFNNNNGFFSDATPGFNNGPNSIGAGAVKWGDYDNDGDQDAFISGDFNNGFIDVYKNDKGTFSKVISLSGDCFYNIFDLGDYDKDGDLDIVIGGNIHNNATLALGLYVYENKGGNFTPSLIAKDSFLAGYSSCKWGDYDNDGDLDILITHYVGGSTLNASAKIYRNDNGQFTEAYSLPYGRGAYENIVEWGDYDNDGDLDILMSGEGYVDVFNNNQGQFQLAFTSTVCISCIYGRSHWGDFDNDGDLDILATGVSSTAVRDALKIYRNTNGAFTEYQANTLDSGGTALWGDYDNDGDLDILKTGNRKNFPSNIYKNNLDNLSTVKAVNANGVPGAPTNLMHTTSGSTTTLSWDQGIDKPSANGGEATPSVAISYNVYIKDSNGNLVVSPMADLTNGKLRVVDRGNCYANTYRINCLSNGTYYWSVQSIDHGFEASAFAPEQSFTVSNANTPLVQNLSPGNNSINNPLTADLVLTFSDNMFKGSGTVYLRLFSDNSIVESFNVATSPLISITNNIVSINPTNDLQDGVGYYIEIPGTAFKNSCNQFYQGTVGSATWNFNNILLSQNITFALLNNPYKYGDGNIQLIASGGASGNPVNFTSDNPIVATIVNGDQLQINATGSATITASQAGNATYNAAPDVQQMLIVVSPDKINQSIAFTPISSKIMGDPAFTLEATATSRLGVTFSSQDDEILIDGSQVTILKAGFVTINADQSGDATYNPAPRLQQTFCINPAKPVIAMSTVNPETPLLTSSSTTGNQWLLNGNIMQGAAQQTYTAVQAGSYTVQVTQGTCLSSLSDAISIAVTGVEKEIKTAVYPNPAESEIYLTTSSAPVSVQIIDLVGKPVKQFSYTHGGNLKIDIADLAAGSYIISASQNGKRQNIHFVKK